ncbi:MULTISPECIES: potassium channel family protein [unclassified Lebetimonas]|uniref:potassium channel family protein n=1 Tax=unclassified Lebetimonas TaxID=2648158 RepID=UPI000465DA72|nr:MULTISPECIES: potassium channel protein [unclassified Lebetimonas]
MNNQAIWIILKKLRAPFLVLLLTFSISIAGLMLIPAVDNQGHIYHLNFFDAFYFVSYMATTIGFGEGPYAFTYPQKLWVTFSIYLTVIGWFYAIGTIVALIQDESLKKAINIGKFIKQVKSLREEFFIVLGYNRITKEIINNSDFRFVVIDKSEVKTDELNLENFNPIVPAIAGDATNEIILKYAGIESKYCRGVISLFENDAKNMQIATICKLLNPNVDLIVKATSKSQEDYYKSLGIKYIKNPFKIISERIFLNLTKPYIWLLELWAFGHKLMLEKNDFLPKGKYLICGYGRMGQALENGLKRANMQFDILKIETENYEKEKGTVIFGDEEDRKLLEKLDIKNTQAIIAATNNDLLNLTIINKAKKLNPSIYTIARENSLDDITIFQAAKIDRIYVLEKITAEYTITNISRPLVDSFINEIRKKENSWAEVIVNMLRNIAGDDPLYYEITINKENAYALMLKLQKRKITLGDIRKSRENRNELLHIVYLLLKRGENIILMPSPDTEIQENDKLLIASDNENLEDFEYIINNIYELEYVLGE